MIDSGWVAVGVSIGGSALLGVGSYFVMRERVNRVAVDMAEKIDRREFEEAIKRFDLMHQDLRDIRNLLSEYLIKMRGS